MKNNNSVISFGKLIRNLRESKQLSLRDVSNSIGIDSSLLGKLERNERFPTKDQIKLVADFFKMDEHILIRELISDQFAYKVIEENIDLDILRVAEKKIEYLILHRK